MAFYKYLKKKHLQQFKEEGKIAVGNIEYYRDEENNTISDPFEGRTVYSIQTEDGALELSVEQVNAITNDYHITAALRIEPYSFFRSSLKVPNAYTFSFSCKLSHQLMMKLGYDAFYTITDVNGFTEAIYAELNRCQQLLFSVSDRVRYVQTKTFNITNANKHAVIRTSPYDRAKSDRIKTIYIEDYFTKQVDFEHEEEFRLLFVPATPVPKDILFLHCKELLCFCEF